MPDLAVWAWAILALAAIVIGLSKAAVPGAGALAIVGFAAVLPAKQSTGTILLLLVFGDMLALLLYRREADFRALLRLAPAVIAGLLVGVAFLAWVNDDVLRRVIAVILLATVAVTLWLRRREQRAGSAASRTPTDGRPTTEEISIPAKVPFGQTRTAAAIYGGLGGFTTMVANAAGPIMSMYFLASRFDVRAFLGTAAWFFAIVNVSKLPFSIALGLITPQGLLIVAVLIPAVLVGAAIGRSIARRISQRAFDIIMISLTIVGSLYLLLAP